MKHWFKFSVDHVPGNVLDCIEITGNSRSNAEKLLRSKWPNITFIHYYGWGDNPPSWYR